MKTYKIRIILLSTFLLVAAGLAQPDRPNVYYVSFSGNTDGTGVTITKPFRSINEAIRKALPGDTVYVLPGTYNELVTISGKQGLPEQPIFLIGYSADTANYPVIDGGAVRPSSEATHDWIRISNSQWIEVARLKFRNGWTFPVKVRNSSYLTFRSCKFWGGKRVINASDSTTHHILVEDCFWDQGGEFLWRIEKDAEGVDAWTSMHHGSMAYFNGSLIDFSGTGGSMVIRRNTMVNAFQAVRFRGRKGFDHNAEIYENRVSNMRDNDFEPEYYTYNLHIYHNVSHNVHKTLSVDNVEGGQIYYYGNIATADTDPWSTKICTGVWKVYGSQRRLSYPLYAFNNSFLTSGLAFMTMHGKAMHLKHSNNAYFFREKGGWELNEWDASDEFDHDLSNKPWAENLTANKQEQHGVIADANFADPARGDLRVKQGSQAIDAGRIVALKEFEWTQSYEGKAPEIGAYENGVLVEGPPFRFMVPPEGKLYYREKPRIVRHRLDGRKVEVYFSDAIDPSSLTRDDVAVYNDQQRLKVASVAFSRNNYQMVLEVNAAPDPNSLSLSFKKWPRGVNGEIATSWASTIRIRKPEAQGSSK